MAELRQQQTLLKTHIQGEVALASSECTHQLESAQYTWRQKALMMERHAQSESTTVAKLQAHSSQVDSCVAVGLALRLYDFLAISKPATGYRRPVDPLHRHQGCEYC